MSKIIDWQKKGNLVRFYLGADGLEDYTGDDWDDVPYEHKPEKSTKNMSKPMSTSAPPLTS